MPVLTLVDVMGIQAFTFASNRLRDVVGGSLLVARATSDPGWVAEVAVPRDGDVIIAAGGNALVRFPQRGPAMDFAAAFSRRLLDSAPGLACAVVHQEYAEGGLAGAILAALEKAQVAKLERQPDAPLLGLGVTAACGQTRLLAVAIDTEPGEDDTVPVSAGVWARRQELRRAAGTGAAPPWEQVLNRVGRSFCAGGGPEVELEYPLQIDDLGRSAGETSLMGVVHIDGNGVGPRISRWLKGHAAAQTPDAAVIAQYRELSRALDGLAARALQAMLERLRGALTWEPGRGQYVVKSHRLNAGFVPGQDRQHRRLALPLRPVVQAGDELTLLCDGRVALDLAAAGLRAYRQTAVPLLGGCIGACAGVAVVRVRAPFARAYDLCEALCAEAKGLVRGREPSGDCAVDWHIDRGVLMTELRRYRAEAYRSGRFTLTLRPYPVGPNQQFRQETWEWLADTVLGADGFGFHSRPWRLRRHKVKALAELARRGPEAVAAALDAWRLVADLPLPGLGEDGYTGGEKTALLDAVELLDVHLPLDPGGDAHGQA